MVRVCVFLLLFLAFPFGNVLAQSIIPKPKEFVRHEAAFTLLPKTVIQVDTIDFEALYLQQKIEEITGLTLQISTQSAPSKIHLTKRFSGPETLAAKDAYYLAVDANSVVLNALTSVGMFYGIQSFLQLIPPQKQSKVLIPSVQMMDHSTFAWRGMHLDVSRHFFSVEEIKKYLDYLALYKFNVFHWHLTDDQGWRIEIKQFPKLTQIGAWRPRTMKGHYRDQTYESKPYGGYYTQEQIKDVVAYANERHITVVPEIEMPGHALAALAAYPEFSCTGGPFEVEGGWGVFDDVFCPKPQTFDFLKAVLDEVFALFPSKYIHIGGDECPKTRWKSCPHCQRLITDLGLKDEFELQSYFIRTIENYVHQKGRQIIGWDEILEGGLAPRAAVMSWRGTEGGIEAAKAGHEVVMTPTSHCYFDFYQGEPEHEPLAIGGFTPLHKVYQFHPIPNDLPQENHTFILGAQANVWTEYIKTFDQVEYMIFPRLTALAEVLWGTANPAHYAEFEQRVIHHMKRWDQMNIRYSRSMFEMRSEVEVIQNEVKLTLKAPNPSGIRYTTNGTAPAPNAFRYASPISVRESQSIQAAYFENDTQQSHTIKLDFWVHKATAKNITLEEPPSTHFSKGNPNVLVDGMLGNSEQFGTRWLGFWGKDMKGILDLGKTERISRIAFHTFLGETSWIYFPKNIRWWYSQDGINYKILKHWDEGAIEKAKGVFDERFKTVKARYLKFDFEHYGIIPDQKPGAGHASWLFVDELMVE